MKVVTSSGVEELQKRKAEMARNLRGRGSVVNFQHPRLAIIRDPAKVGSHEREMVAAPVQRIQWG